MNLFHVKGGGLLPLFAVLLFLCPFTVHAQNTISAGISVEEGYDSNIYRQPHNEVDELTTTISPSITYTRDSRRSSFSARYSPGFVYSSRTEDTRIDHSASAGYQRDLTRNLQVDFSNRFVKTEDPYDEPDLPEYVIDLSDRRGRREYWSNNFSASAGYTYGPDRVLEIGYRNSILENREETYSDYVKHAPYVRISHSFDHQWESRIRYGFERGEFDEADHVRSSEDLSRNSWDAYQYYRTTRFTRLFGHLGFSRTNYDDASRLDYRVYTVSAGAEHQYSRTLDLEMEAGGSVVAREDRSDSRAFYLRARIDKQWERTSWYAKGESGLDFQEFSGVDDLGLSRYWIAGTGIARTLMKDVRGNADVFYRFDEYLERDPSPDERRIEASAGLSWSFGRWYRLFCRYTFIDQDAYINADKYVDHRFFAGISAEKEFFRW